MIEDCLDLTFGRSGGKETIRIYEACLDRQIAAERYWFESVRRRDSMPSRGGAQLCLLNRASHAAQSGRKNLRKGSITASVRFVSRRTSDREGGPTGGARGQSTTCVGSGSK
jgi:hypothetical protein